jgi:hypothetical protein
VRCDLQPRTAPDAHSKTIPTRSNNIEGRSPTALPKVPSSSGSELSASTEMRNLSVRWLFFARGTRFCSKHCSLRVFTACKQKDSAPRPHVEWVVHRLATFGSPVVVPCGRLFGLACRRHTAPIGHPGRRPLTSTICPIALLAAANE